MVETAVASEGVALAGGVSTSRTKIADSREARPHATQCRAAVDRGRPTSSTATSSRPINFAEGEEYPPLPGFRQSLSSALTNPGSSSFVSDPLKRVPSGGCLDPSGRTAPGSRGGGVATPAAKGQTLVARERERREPGKTSAGGTSISQGGTHAKPSRAGMTIPQREALNSPTGPTVDPAVVAPITTARGRSGSYDSTGGENGAAQRASGETTERTTGRTSSTTEGTRGWAAFIRSFSRERRAGKAPEQCHLMRTTNGAPEGTETNGTAGVDGEQQDLVQRKEHTELKAMHWMVGGSVVYFILGILVLYCISYANVEWCCIFVLFGSVVGAVGLIGLRKSNRTLLLIHVGAACVLLFTLFVAWCYNLHVLLRAFEILLASSWPPLHHHQFKYYYSIPTLFESPPAPWVEEMLLLRLEYPSEDAAGIWKLLGEPRRGRESNGRRSTSNTHPSGDEGPPRKGTEDSGSPGAAEIDGRIGNDAPKKDEEATGKAGKREESRGLSNAVDAEANFPRGGRDTASAPFREEARQDRPSGRRLKGVEKVGKSGLESEDVGAAFVVETDWQRGTGAEASARPWTRRLSTKKRGDFEGSALLYEVEKEDFQRDERQEGNTWVSQRETRMRGAASGRTSTAPVAHRIVLNEEYVLHGNPTDEAAALASASQKKTSESHFFTDATATFESAAPSAPTVGGTERRGADKEKRMVGNEDHRTFKEALWQIGKGGSLHRRRLQETPPPETTPRSHGASTSPQSPPAKRDTVGGLKRSHRDRPREGEEAERLRVKEADEKKERSGQEENKQNRVPGVSERTPAPARTRREPDHRDRPAALLRSPRGPSGAEYAAAASEGASANAGAATSIREDKGTPGQQRRSSDSVQPQPDVENTEKKDAEENDIVVIETVVEPITEPPSSADVVGRENTLSAAYQLAAEQASVAGAKSRAFGSRGFVERDAGARTLIRGCVEGAKQRINFLDDVANAMSSVATRGWLCAFARAEMAPFHRWPVDCSSECGYSFLDAGHDLHVSNFYDMTRVAEFLIQVSSLPPKKTQRCIDYAASTICTIKNRNFFVVWVVVLLVWLLAACIACVGILPVSVYKTVQVIKGMQHP